LWGQWNDICGVIGCAPVSAVYCKWMWASKVCRIAENMFRKCVLRWNYVFCKARWHIMGNILSWVSRTCVASLVTKKLWLVWFIAVTGQGELLVTQREWHDANCL
jgi:hypothetical protein